MRVSDSVRIVPVPEDNPMHPQQTNIYVVGKGEVLTIDSGEAIDKFRWMLRGYLAAVEKTEIGLAAITHHHFDHSGNLKHVHEELRAEVAVPDNGVRLLKGRLPKEGVRTIAEGTVLDLDGGVRVEVFATPGHSVDSLCYYIEKEGVLFTGDTLLGVGTTTVGDLNTYRASLRRLLELPNLKVLCPGHGPLVHDARERLEMYVRHREMREEQILAALRGKGPRTSWEIMLELYPDIDTRLRRAADGNVRAHLDALAGVGAVGTHKGTRRQRNPDVVRREREKERERAKVIRLAKRYEKEARRRTLRRQESPPTERWSRAPRYELIREPD